MDVGREPSRQPRPTARTGQMTAAMRAMAVADGPRVLRIGVVRAGRVIEERVKANGTGATLQIPVTFVQQTR